MYKHNNNNNKFRSQRRNSDREFMTTREKTDASIPTKEDKISSDSQYLMKKGFSDLRYSGVIATKADPQTTATTASQPYSIIAGTNKVIDAKYPGDDNLSGNVVVQLMNSNESKLTNNFDSGRLEISVNYLYLNYDDNPKTPYAANVYMGAAINESLSRTNSEMYTNLAFAQYEIETECAKMDTSNHAYVVLLYQTILQNCATILGKYVELMSLEKQLINMGYNREAYYTIELFGLLKKKSFVQKMNALSVFIQGEYFDQDWYKQINILTLTPSRKSTSMRDPLLTIKSSHNIPNVSVSLNGNKIFDQDTFTVTQTTRIDKQTFFKESYTSKRSGNILSKKNGTKTTVTYDMQDLCRMITTRFDQASVIEWARDNYMGTIKIPVQDYYNVIVKYLDWATRIMAQFSRVMSETRTYLDVMNKLNLNNWKQGTTFDVSAIKQIEPSFNIIVANVFKSYLASPQNITWNPITQRWQFYSLWDEFTGIPTYDKFSGGSFLTFSVREVDLIPDTELDSSEYLIPKLFSVQPNSIIVVNREGITIPVNYQTMTADEINKNPITSRLLPLSSMKPSIRIPLVDVSDLTNSADVASSVYETVQTIAGIGRVNYGKQPEEYNLAIDRDLVSLVDIQMNDVANAMLSFVRAYSPFKVWLSNGSRTIGFGSK